MSCWKRVVFGYIAGAATITGIWYVQTDATPKTDRVLRIMEVLLAPSIAVAALALGWLEVKRHLRPVIVMERGRDKKWKIKNIGGGPALDVIVTEEHKKSSDAGPSIKHIRYPPLGAGETYEIGDGPVSYSVTYKDAEGAAYHTRCKDYLNEVSEKSFPLIPESSVTRYGDMHDKEPPAEG